MPDLPIAIRARTPVPINADENDPAALERSLIHRSWVGSSRAAFKKGKVQIPSDRSLFGLKNVPNRAYDKIMRPVIYRAVDVMPIWVACHPDATEQVFGWICAEPDKRLLHYLFVKSRFRGFGLGLRLISEVVKESGAKLTITHKTPSWTAIMDGCELTNGYKPEKFQPFSEGR